MTRDLGGVVLAIRDEYPCTIGFGEKIDDISSENFEGSLRRLDLIQIITKSILQDIFTF